MRSWFSTFPGGKSAVALLLLRLTVSVTALGQGIACLESFTWVSFLRAAALIPSGFCVLIGFVTPAASLVTTISILAISTPWFVSPGERLLDSRGALLEVAIISLSLAMMGPGSFSLDARFFGRREIVIPPRSRPKQF